MHRLSSRFSDNHNTTRNTEDQTGLSGALAPNAVSSGRVTRSFEESNFVVLVNEHWKKAHEMDEITFLSYTLCPKSQVNI